MAMIDFLIDLLGSVTTNNAEFYSIIKLDPRLAFLIFFFFFSLRLTASSIKMMLYLV